MATQNLLPPHVMRQPAETRFWSRVQKSETCWVWTGATSHAGGYGMLRVNGRNVKTHRFSYEMAYGPIPKGEGYHGVCVLHTCDNPACVRPDHLRLGTQRENVRDMIEKGRAPDRSKQERHCPVLTVCMQGHEFTPENTYISPAGVKRCRACDKATRQRRANTLRRIMADAFRIPTITEPLMAALREADADTFASEVELPVPEHYTRCTVCSRTISDAARLACGSCAS